MSKIIGGLFGGGGGGGGSSAPTNQTITQTSIPEYARPYVESMLGKSAALTDINANPYQSYGGQRIQGFTPMQERAFQNYATQQIAPELGAGSNMAALSGLGSLTAGSDYMRMASDPRSMQSFMSPYMQNVVDMQKQEATRDYEKGLGALNAKAVGSGAFGGTRASLERAEAGRNLGTTLANIQATGSQNAFDKAQQAQQFGSTLGLQGYGQGIQAASTLGQLGQTRYGQEMGISDAIARAGAVQQAQGQQGLDLAYQDFTQQKNYPYQQLAFQSDMLRGLPLSQSSQQMYSAAPSTMSQLGGLGTTALGIYGMSGGFKKDGGVIKGYKNGGQIGYLDGGEVEMMTTEQLEKLLASPNLNPLEVAMIQKALMERKRMASNPQAQEMMSRSGIGAISTGDMVPEEMTMAANGGIIAFANGNEVKKPEGYADYREIIKKRLEALDSGTDPFAKSSALQEEYAKGIEDRRAIAPWQAVTQAGLAMMAGTSPNALTNIGAGGAEGFKSYARSSAEEAADRKLMLQQQVEAEKSKYARDMGNLSTLITAQGQLDAKEIATLNRKSTDANTAAVKQAELERRADQNFRDGVAKFKSLLIQDEVKKFEYERNPYKLQKDAYKNAYDSTSPATRKLLDLKDPDELYPEQKSGDNKGSKPASTASGGRSSPPPPPGFKVQP
jgi:hypothetical protein